MTRLYHTYTVTIDTDNAAFEGHGCMLEVARILADLVARIKNDHASGATRILRDANGNRVGTAGFNQ